MFHKNVFERILMSEMSCYGDIIANTVMWKTAEFTVVQSPVTCKGTKVTTKEASKYINENNSGRINCGEKVQQRQTELSSKSIQILKVNSQGKDC